MKKRQSPLRTLFVAALIAAVPACVAPRHAPDADGVSFPLREASYRREGIVVAAETIRLLQPGLSKDQVRQMLGDPHFTEGLFFVRDWNYLLKLPAPEGGLLDCQFQLRFDEHGKVTSTHWQTGECAAAAMPPPAAAAIPAPETGTGTRDAAKIELWSEDGLVFAFGRSDLAGLRDEDRARLEAFAAQVGQQPASVRRISVAGHADRIGSAERKHQRSLSRARTVAAVLASKGIAPERIEIVARSDAAPLAGCAPGLAFADLLACLAPDRRVSVTVLRSPAER